MMRGITRYTLVVGIALGVVIIGGFVALTAAVHALRSAEHSDARTELVLSSSHALEKDVLDLETGVRGYLLTDQHQFLRPYDTAVAGYPTQVERLVQLTSNDRTQQQQVRAISAAIGAYLRDWAAPVVARGATNLSEVRHTVDFSKGKKLVDAIRARFDALNGRQQALADSRRSDLNGLGRLILEFGLAAVVLSTAMIALCGLLMHRGVVLPVRRLAAAVRRFGRGDLSTRVPTKGVAEIGELQGGFNAMADELESQGDTAEQQNAELEALAVRLGESEQRLGRALEAAGIGAWALDVASGRMWRSSRHDRIFGYPSPLPEWTFDIALAHVVSDDRAVVKGAFAQAFVSGELRFECRIAWTAGTEHSIRLEGRVERGDDGRPVSVAGTVADVTERVRNDQRREQLEDQLRQSQKMEAVGQLAGGIAHDFNNILTVICGYSQYALTKLDGADPDLRSDIEKIADAGDRAAQLTRQLLAFSRRQTLQPVVFDLNDAVSDGENLLRRLLGEHIDILSSLSPLGCMINADRGQIEQVLMNLAVNARDAMPGGGTLTIETERIRIPGGEAGTRLQTSAGEYVLLRVSDTGCGMNDATRARAFEPFFTTKPVGEGTGLGLATVFGIVGQNAGTITLTSEPDTGTTFEILLPLATAAITAAASVAPRTPVLGTERILLVEDDTVVRAFANEILIGNGYEVIAAADGEEALSFALDHPFDLLITDIVMPKLSGKELALQLRLAQPGLPVVYMSGYAHDIVGDHPTPGDAFIQKPFSAHDLSATARAKLDSTRTPHAPTV